MRRLQAGVAAIFTLTVAALGGCTTATPAQEPQAPNGMTLTRGQTYAFGLPNAPAFSPGKNEDRPDGTKIRRWQRELAPGGPFCTVVASEQLRYSGKFPDAPIMIFHSLEEAGDVTVANEEMPAPAGAAKAIRQEQTFDSRLPNGAKVRGRLHQRQYLTPDQTLVSLTATDLDEPSAPCQARSIIETLQIIPA